MPKFYSNFFLISIPFEPILGYIHSLLLVRAIIKVITNNVERKIFFNVI